MERCTSVCARDTRELHNAHVVQRDQWWCRGLNDPDVGVGGEIPVLAPAAGADDAGAKG